MEWDDFQHQANNGRGPIADDASTTFGASNQLVRIPILSVFATTARQANSRQD